MFAVIETGGKQYKVEKGTIIDIEKLPVEKNTDVKFENILLISDGKDVKIGQPYVKGASVTATVLNQIKSEKTIAFKFKRKIGYQKKSGHRQKLTTIKIEAIAG